MRLKGKTQERSIFRDEYEPVRERAAARLNSVEGKEACKKRMPVGEGTFGILKAVMGCRQFLLRGLEKLATELDWMIAAFDLKTPDYRKIRAMSW